MAEISDCECHVRGDMQIIYCPLHAAAPELLERLKKCAEWAHSRGHYHSGTFAECQKPECAFSRKAITRIGGN